MLDARDGPSSEAEMLKCLRGAKREGGPAVPSAPCSDSDAKRSFPFVILKKSDPSWALFLHQRAETKPTRMMDEVCEVSLAFNGFARAKPDATCPSRNG